MKAGQSRGRRTSLPGDGNAWGTGVFQGVVLGLMVSLGGLVSDVSAQVPAADRLETLGRSLAEAEEAGAHLIAPRLFERARDRYEDGSRRMSSGRVDDRLVEILEEAEATLRRALEVHLAGQDLFGEILTMRAAARAVQAPARAPELWDEAETGFRRAGERFERGDADRVPPLAARAADAYRRARVAALRDLLLGDAIDARTEASALDAAELAPHAFGVGETALREANAALGSVGELDRAATLAQEAQTAFERSADIAALSDSVLQKLVTVESLMESHLADLVHLGKVIGVAVAEDDPEAIRDRVADEIDGLLAHNRDLSNALDSVRTVAAAAAARADTADARVEAAQTRFAEVSSALLEMEERQRQLREVSGLFAPSEGEVSIVGDRLELSLHGLTFESGAAEIEEELHPILTKVQRVLTMFERAQVRINGHTDSQGNAARNRALSQRRAIAVREYLLARVPIPSARIEAEGYGEERPIANNETEEGRARNRRIEIIVTLPEPPN